MAPAWSRRRGSEDLLPDARLEFVLACRDLALLQQPGLDDEARERLDPLVVVFRGFSRHLDRTAGVDLRDQPLLELVPGKTPGLVEIDNHPERAALPWCFHVPH